MPKTTYIEKVLLANQNITSGFYVAIPNTNFNHIFTKKNVKIRCYNITLVNNTASEKTGVRIDLDGFTLLPPLHGDYTNTGTSQREGTAQAIFSNVPAGSRQVQLLGYRSAGTGTLHSNTHLIFEIQEWD